MEIRDRLPRGGSFPKPGGIRTRRQFAKGREKCRRRRRRKRRRKRKRWKEGGGYACQGKRDVSLTNCGLSVRDTYTSPDHFLFALFCFENNAQAKKNCELYFYYEIFAHFAKISTYFISSARILRETTVTGIFLITVVSLPSEVFASHCASRREKSARARRRQINATANELLYT